MHFDNTGFPNLKDDSWRSNTPCVIELNDSIRTTAYPILGKIDENGQLHIGLNKSSFWMVIDPYFEHELAIDSIDYSFVSASDVCSWEFIDPKAEIKE